MTTDKSYAALVFVGWAIGWLVIHFCYRRPLKNRKIAAEAWKTTSEAWEGAYKAILARADDAQKPKLIAEATIGVGTAAVAVVGQLAAGQPVITYFDPLRDPSEWRTAGPKLKELAALAFTANSGVSISTVSGVVYQNNSTGLTASVQANIVDLSKAHEKKK